jgi:hypothetical protein
MLLAAGLVGHANRYHNVQSNSSERSANQTQSFVPFSGPSGLAKQPSAEDRKEAREEADLAAQERMAAAASSTVYIGALTLFLLSLTVFYAHKAWKAAAQANGAAADGAKAAWASEKSAREIGQKQSMAYVHGTKFFVPARLELDNDEIVNAMTNYAARLKMTLSNVGQTIAKEVYVEFELCDETASESSKFRELRNPVIVPIANIAPGQNPEIELLRDLRNAFLDSDKSDDRHRFGFRTLRGMIIYDDVFNNTYRTAFLVATFFDTDIRTAPKEEIEYHALAANLPAYELIYSAEEKSRDKASQ